MTKEEYREQLQSKEWEFFRNKVIDYYGNQCWPCGSYLNPQAHHKWYIDGRKAWEYTMHDMSVLCETCHVDYHNEHSIKVYDKNLKYKFNKMFYTTTND
jgi:5-methylcytosine-specific restriction endonuclease McrA